MKTKHTEGEWQILDEHLHGQFSPPRVSYTIGIKDKINKSPICKTIELWIDDTAKANAKLIAAAPKLLEALQDVVNFVSGDLIGVSLEEVLNAANKAIKEATE